jgi:DNA polymerase I-like protein with 3'-5' exonuclease and polymerase domains
LWKDVRGSDEVKICAAIHDELLLLVREGKEEKWAAILQKAMEGAEAKWLKDVPAVADVKIGKTWQECH